MASILLRIKINLATLLFPPATQTERLLQRLDARAQPVRLALARFELLVPL
jgi:hypothetical protein